MLRGTKNRQCVLCLRNVGGPLVTPYNRPIKIRDSFEAFGISIFHFPFFPASDVSLPHFGALDPRLLRAAPVQIAEISSSRAGQGRRRSDTLRRGNLAGGDGSSARSSWSGLLLRLSPPPVTPTESNKKKIGGYFGMKKKKCCRCTILPPLLAGNNDCTTAVILKGHPPFFCYHP